MLKKISLIKVLLILLFSKAFEVQAVLIVGAGLPSSGKSTTFKELAKIYKTEYVFLEPEEPSWPKLLTKKDIIDPFNLITWLRANRVANLLEAESLSKKGEVVLVDSYYDKLLYSYIGNEDHKWLINKDHKYFNTLKNIAKLDQENLPDADFIVFLKVDYSTWRNFLISRNRGVDKKIDLINYYYAEKSILKACKNISKKAKTKLIIYNQDSLLSPKENAEKIYNMISFKGQ